MKTYTIEATTIYSYDRPNSTSTFTGTVEELTKMFSYTLMVANQYRRINQHPKTITGLINAINRAEGVIQGSCYTRTYVSLVK